jgi:hypothetical protein
MSTTQALIDRMKAELKAAGLTYAALARELGMAESSIKRMFARGEMPLSRVDEVCRVMKTDFAELARQVADTTPKRTELTLDQEKAVVADRRLLLMAICCLSQWTFEQIVASYTLNDAECVKYLVQLDRLGVIELRPLNRYRLNVAKTFRWRTDGPVMVLSQTGGRRLLQRWFLDGEGEMLMLVHGQIGRSLAALFNERLQRVAQDLPSSTWSTKTAARTEAPTPADRHALVAVRGIS